MKNITPKKTKTQYNAFKNLYLSEQAFRECWGKQYGDMVERRNNLLRTGHTLLAGRLHERLEMLTNIFMSLEEFRVKK